MVKGRPKPTPVNAPAEVVFDPSAPGARRPRRPGAPSSSSSTGEWHNFMVSPPSPFCISRLILLVHGAPG